MKVHTLDIDSGERDTNVYTHANSYSITLKEAIYDVTHIKLVSARIPTPQLTTCVTNKSFTVKGSGGNDVSSSLITLDETNYASGTALASDLDTKMQPPITCIDSVIFDTDTEALTFSNTHNSNNFTFSFFDGQNGFLSNTAITTPHQVIGFSSSNHTSSGNSIVSGAINLEGPNSLILRIRSGSDEFTKTVYSATPFYTGHILMDGTDFINFNGTDDPLTHEFYSGPQKYIKELQFEFFYMSNGRLIPYDFRNQDHILKFEITCSTDKLEGLPRVRVPLDDEVVEKDLPPPISITEAVVDSYKWKEYLSIGIIVFIGLVLLILMKRKPKITG